MTAPSPVPYPELWAKTATGAETGTTYGYPLYNHLDDTASVAEAVIERWVGAKNSAAYTKLSEHLGIPPEKALTFACLAHDIGKADPHFQAKVEELACSNPWYTTPVGVGAPHNIVSAQTVREFLSRHGAIRPATRGWATVLAGHHGVLDGTTERPKKMNNYETWLKARLDLLDVLCETHGISELDLEALGRIEWRAGTVTLLTSLLITCDWLASNETAFPIPAMPGIETGRARADKAMGENLALGPTWEPDENPAGQWQKRFNLPPDTELHDAQKDVLDAARRMSDKGGLLLIESATGSGKSAAALLAADIVAAKTGATGIIYAQPSQATANSALPTVASWVAKHPSGAPVGASLAHGKARFVQDASDVYRLSDGAITTHWWTTGRLAPFAPVTVSTIDQVLQSVLKARYAALRQAALVGKVVVLDEVHSSDSHMSVYLERFLEYAGYWGTTVIAMSATLSDTRRHSLVTAYESGMTGRASQRETPEPTQPRGTSLPTTTAHSRVTVLGSSGLRDTGRLEESGTEIAVSFGAVAAEDIAKEVSQQVIQRPSCVGVVLNTVSRAQDVFEAVSAAVPEVEVVLLHSRFTVTDRREIEQRVTDALGRNGSRPESLVVVATQVVEQALDLDFDVLYIDIAPVDMLVQRLGRLHRHDRTRPAGRERAEAVVTGVDMAGGTRPEFAPGIDTVYDPATLYQTLACLIDKQHISRPQDVPGLVRAVFDACPQFPASWGDMSDVLDARDEAETAARTHAEKAVLPAPYDRGWWKSIETILGDADYTPGVRAGSYTTEICLLRRDGEEVVPVSAGDADPKSETTIAASTVPVPNYVIEDNYNDLVNARPVWWPKRGATRWLAPVVLDGGGAEIGQWVLRYDSRIGVRVGKRDGGEV